MSLQLGDEAASHISTVEEEYDLEGNEIWIVLLAQGPDHSISS